MCMQIGKTKNYVVFQNSSKFSSQFIDKKTQNNSLSLCL